MQAAEVSPTMTKTVAILMFCCAAAVLTLLCVARRPGTLVGVLAQRGSSEGELVLPRAGDVEPSGREARTQIAATPEPLQRLESHESLGIRDAVIDPVGVSDEERLRSLIRAHDYALRISSSESAPDELKAGAEFLFAGSCVISILHAKGRAEFDTAPDGKFHVGSMREDEYLIGGDRAQYRFLRGEFPAYDLAYDRRCSFQQRSEAGPIDRARDFDDRIQDLYDQALASFGINKAGRR